MVHRYGHHIHAYSYPRNEAATLIQLWIFNSAHIWISIQTNSLRNVLVVPGIYSRNSIKRYLKLEWCCQYASSKYLSFPLIMYTIHTLLWFVLACWFPMSLILFMFELTVPGRCSSRRCSCDFKLLISRLMSKRDIFSILCKIDLRWKPQDLTDGYWTLVQVMASCLMAPSHFLCQCWPNLCHHMASLGHNEFIMVTPVPMMRPWGIWENVHTNFQNKAVYISWDLPCFAWPICLYSLHISWGTWGPFYKHGLILIPAWVNNYIHYKGWD